MTEPIVAPRPSVPAAASTSPVLLEPEDTPIEEYDFAGAMLSEDDETEQERKRQQASFDRLNF